MKNILLSLLKEAYEMLSDLKEIYISPKQIEAYNYANEGFKKAMKNKRITYQKLYDSLFDITLWVIELQPDEKFKASKFQSIWEAILDRLTAVELISNKLK